MKTLLRDDQLKYSDVEGMRMVTSKKCASEQIKSDKVENVATGGMKNGEFGKVGKRQKFQEHCDEWSRKWKVGNWKLEN